MKAKRLGRGYEYLDLGPDADDPSELTTSAAPEQGAALWGSPEPRTEPVPDQSQV
ncbi:hypothetical protein BZL29_0195 [Mycobacterium kansasii]|uniref:Uncharacterized protein n=1 Tax=Mycobacterium kansasii TaxID=1768 RepID=A0A1V3XYY8_MYCKA|nr:hypothetical protein BZL29_0195 [Mycobacterium kansasii]